MMPSSFDAYAVQSGSRRYPVEPRAWGAALLAGLAMVLFIRAFPGYFAGTTGLGALVSPLIVWAGFSAMFYLFAKRWRLANEEAIFSTLAERVLPELLRRTPSSRGPELLGELVEQTEGIDARHGTNCLLLRRARLALAARGSQTGLSGEELAAETEHGELERSYALPRLFIWAMPILGFIGTVLGISQAIGTFSVAMSAVQSATEISAALREQLPAVTRGLSLAFDTTLLGLAFSLPAMIVLVWVERKEQGLMAEVDRVWLGQLGPRLLRATDQGPADSTVPATLVDQVKELGDHIKLLHDVVRWSHESTRRPSEDA